MPATTVFHRVQAEARHFDRLVRSSGESWWGHNTAAGVIRLRGRAKRVVQGLPIGAGFRLLEIAAGAGALTEAILREAPSAEIVATDISPESVRRLGVRVGRFPSATTQVDDAMALSHSTGTFDAVIGNSALHHLDVPAALREAHRVLKPGGRLLMFEPNLFNPQVYFEMNLARRFARSNLEYSDDEQTFTRWTYARMLRQCGFTDVSVRPFDFTHPLTPRSAVRMIQAAGALAERIPLLREIAGSLCLSAVR